MNLLIYKKLPPDGTSLHDVFLNGAANGRLKGFWKQNLHDFSVAEVLNSPKHSALLSEALRYLRFPDGCTCMIHNPFLSSRNSIQLLKRRSLLWHCFLAWKNPQDKHSEASFCLWPQERFCSCIWSAQGVPASRCSTFGISLLPPVPPGTQALIMASRKGGEGWKNHPGSDLA